MKTSKIVAIIPARAGSKGITNKNTKLLGSKPLIDYSIDFALRSEVIDEIIVSTDIESVYYKYKDSKQVIINGLRPSSLSNDTASTSDVIKYELGLCTNMQDTDICVLLQPTCPFRREHWLVEALEKLRDKSYSSSVTMVSVGGNHPYRMYRISAERAHYLLPEAEKDPLRPRQLLEPLYIRSGHIYAFPIKTLKLYNNIVGPDIYPVVIPSSESVNIDTLSDWRQAESLLDTFS